MKHVFVKIKPSDTTVDHRYQRDFDQRRVDAMTRAYNPNLIGVPVVSKREDGSCVRIDGQHRLATCIAAGHGDVPLLMEVHEGLSLQEEAELFLRLNGGRTAVGAIDKFKAKLVAREPIALEIFAILKRLGCKITRSPSRGGVMAVNAVEAAHRHGNLEPTMRSLVTWLDGDTEAFHGDIIRAVSAFLVACPEADPLHLAARLADQSPERLRTRLKRETQQLPGFREDAARLVLTEIYNRNTKQARRVQWHPGSAVAPKAKAS